MSLVKEYFELTAKYKCVYGENTILLMQVGSFFEVYGLMSSTPNMYSGSKINDFSRMCDLNIVEKNTCVGKDSVVMAGFKDNQIEKYIKKMQEFGFTVVVYTQDEAAKNTTRSLAGVFSPGTYFSNDTKHLTNNLTCIWIEFIENKMLFKGKHVIVGASNIDIYTGKTVLFQFQEVYVNNPTTYDELERFISIYNPCETIIISNLPKKETDDIILYANINSILIHKLNLFENNDKNKENDKNNANKLLFVKNCEKQVYQKEILRKFYKKENYDSFFENFNDHNIATQSFCYLLDFVYQHNPHLVNKIYEPIFDNCSNRLILANHSLKQLNIIPDDNDTGKHSCVLKMLNNCLTPMGKRRFNHLFLNPTTDKIYLENEYNITEYFVEKYDIYSTFLKNNLCQINDISKWERQIFLKKMTPKALYNLYNNIQIIKNVFSTLYEDETIKQYLIKNVSDIQSLDNDCQSISQFINDNIDLNVAKDIDQLQGFETNFINSGVHIELDKKTVMLKENEMKLEAVRCFLSDLIENKEKKGKTEKNTEYVKIHETDKNNLSLISTSRRCKLLVESLPRDAEIVFLHYAQPNKEKKYEFKISKTQFEFEKQTSTNNSITDVQVHLLCKNISTIKVSLKDQITSVFNEVVEKLEGFKEKIEKIITFVTTADILYCKSTIAKKFHYCKPQIVESKKSFVEATQLRHCLIEQFSSNELYVANDITIGNEITDGVLLYGTNAVGKTSFIKAIGISIIMAQAGLFVPCSAFKYQPYKYLFTRILGNDNIFKGLSTFAVEMSELRTILRLTNENSLVLGDELCSGTETMSAISIFVAGIQQLHKCGCSFIFATHLHEIVNFEEISSLNSVVQKHMSVIYDKANDTLVYDRKLKDGPGSNMYGLEVCKSLNLPDDFLEAAFNIRMKYSPEKGPILSQKSSHFNSNKIVGVCEMCCKNPAKEVHHLQHQKTADDDGIIYNCDGVFHKNNLANLMSLCEDCHNEMHDKFKKGSKRVKTSRGYKIQGL